jgi:hypothetical protein
MKKTIAFMIVATMFSGAAFAGDIIELPASMGKISFPHKRHQELLKDCTKCHEKGPGKISELNKNWAHKNCKGCHEMMKKGPVGCKDCHKK